MMGPAGPGRPAAVMALVVVGSGDADTVVERLTPLVGLAPLADRSVRLTPYSALLALARETRCSTAAAGPFRTRGWCGT